MNWPEAFALSIAIICFTVLVLRLIHLVDKII